MKIEIGRRYHLARYDGLRETDGVVGSDQHGAFIFKPDGLDCEYLVEQGGACRGIGQLREIASELERLPPIFGHDPESFARLQRRFETWDFSWGTS